MSWTGKKNKKLSLIKNKVKNLYFKNINRKNKNEKKDSCMDLWGSERSFL